MRQLLARIGTGAIFSPLTRPSCVARLGPLLLFLMVLTLARPAVALQGDGDDPFADNTPAQAEAKANSDANAVNDLPAPPTEIPARRAARPSSSRGQDTSPPRLENIIQQTDQALENAARLQQELQGGQPQPPLPTPNAVRLVPESIHFGKLYGRNPIRYLAMRLWVANPTEEEFEFDRKDLKLLFDGQERSLSAPPDQPGLKGLPLGSSIIPMEELAVEGTVKAAPGELTSIAVAFFDLPSSPVPKMSLKITGENPAIETDLNQFSLGRLVNKVERLGPRDLLAIVTIQHEITDVAAASLVELIDQLVQAGSSRVILRWMPEAPPVAPEIMNWLSQYQSQRGAVRPLANDGQHPALPEDLAGLYLTEFTGSNPGPPIAFDSLANAVFEALAEPYRAIPLDTLRQEIRSADPLTRPSAVAAGGRLPNSDLPLLLELSRDTDPQIAEAATSALGGFVAPEAVNRLLEIAESSSPDAQTAALTALASSRHGAAHEALHGLLEAALQGQTAMHLDRLSQVLAQYPRGLWRDALYQLSLRGEPADRREALLALARVGHPRFIVALEAALNSDDSTLASQALDLLIERNDPRSEQLALDYTIAFMASKEPTRSMIRLLNYAKDPRAVPLLIQHIQGVSNQTLPMIQLVLTLDDDTALTHIESLYESASPSHRAILLRQLASANSPRTFEFANKGINDAHSPLRHAAMKVFQDDGSPESVAILANAFRNTNDNSKLQMLAAGLAEIGSQDALVALRQAQRKGVIWNDIALKAYFQSIQRHSPGFQAFARGQSLSQRKSWEEAREAYTIALKLDPQLIDAWAARAHVNMQLEDHEAARIDFTKTLSLDAEDPAAITCIAILKVEDGDVEGGLKMIAKHADQFGQNDVFNYNAACVKALASVTIAKTDPDRAEQLRVTAVKDVERSFELGLNEKSQIDWATEDPDLKILQDREDFQQVIEAARKRAAPRNPSD